MQSTNYSRLKAGARRMMKWVACLVLVACLQARAGILAQSVTLHEKNASLTAVFKVIEKQSGYVFFFNYQWLSEARPVSLDLDQAPLEKVLEECFRDQPFTYTIVNKAIVVKQKDQPGEPVTSPVGVMPDIHGVVRDENNKPVAGVSVLVKGTHKGTTTDEHGSFSLKEVDPGATLVFSSVNYETVEIAVKRKTEWTVSLKSKVSQLNDVSVTVSTGYQKIPRERATGSFGIVTAEDLASRPDPGLMERLEGMTSGMLVNVGQQDRDLTLNHDQFSIRGLSTILSEQKPLIVLDGFPTELDLVNINPGDIEKITILKDAAAASIWGVRAANGVLVIDTKKGSYGATPIVSFSSILKLTDGPRLNAIPTANSAQFLGLEKELVDKGILPRPVSPLYPAPPLPQGSGLYLAYKNGQIGQQVLDDSIAQLQQADVRQQYRHYLLRAPFSQQYHLSVSGGSGGMRNFISASYSDEYPFAIGDYGRRLTVNFNNETRLSRRLVFTGESLLTLLQQKNNGIGITGLQPGTTSLAPYDQIVDKNGKGTDFAFVMSSREMDSLQKKGFLSWRYNFLNELANADNTYSSLAYRLSPGLRYDILPSILSAEVKYMMERSYGKTWNYYNQDTYTARNLVNSYTDIMTHANGIPAGGILDQAHSEQNNYSLRGQVNLSPNFGALHRLDMIAGAEIRETLTTGDSSRYYGYDDRTLTAGVVNYTKQYNTVYSFATVPLVQGFTNQRDRYTSVFGNFTYTYNRKYSLSGSIRKDNSNLFGASDKYHAVPLWSVGGLWHLGEEGFMRHDWLTLLNLRATYGYNGNVNKQTSPYLITQTSTQPNPFNGSPYASVFNPANPLLRWEQVATFNLGTDFGLFHNRLSGSLDIYWKKSTYLLGQVSIDPTYGFTNLLTNQLEMTNHGIDLMLAGELITGKAFHWRASVNFSYNINKVTGAYYQQNTTTYYTGGNPVQGRPLNSLFVYRFAGLDQSGTAMLYTGKNTKIAADDYTFDETDLGSVAYKGVTVAPYFGGMTQEFRYRNFELSFLLTYKFGHKFLRPGVDDYYTTPYAHNANADIAQRWEQPGDEKKTDVPAVDPVHLSLYRYRSSDLFVEDAGYIRWKQASLAYHFPAGMLHNSIVKGMTLSVSGQNLAIWTVNKEGIDPDYIPMNSAAILPPSRSFVFSVQANF